MVLAGARDLSPTEATALSRAAITHLTPAELTTPAPLAAALDRIAPDVDAVHLHIDLDVHDPSIAPANGHAAPDGLTAAHVRQAARTVAHRVPIASATLASYDPHDRDDRMRDTALDLLSELARLPPKQ